MFDLCITLVTVYVGNVHGLARMTWEKNRTDRWFLCRKILVSFPDYLLCFSILNLTCQSRLIGSLQVRIELPSHRAHTGALCEGYVCDTFAYRSSMRRVCMWYFRIELLIMFHASNLEVQESGYTAFGLSDREYLRPCMHAFALLTVNINNGLSHDV